MKNLVVFGNPLLDTIVFINDNSLLDKYNLEKDGQKELSSEEMKRITEDVRNESKNTTYIAGGCAQNSMRVLQWLTNKRHKASIVGSVGNDEDAKLLKNLVEKDCVDTHYIVQSGYTTGKTISLVKGVDRSLVGQLGAAEVLKPSDISNNSNFPDIIRIADYIYFEGFFLTKREEAALYILDYCKNLNKIIAFNISGDYVCKMVPKTLQYFVNNSDILFGNKREFEALATMCGLTDTEELVNTLLKNGKQKLSLYGNVVIITDGAQPGTCYYGYANNYSQKFQFKVEEIDRSLIKDTTGAGDAFVGGFLGGMCEGKSIEKCIELACYAAGEIIKQIGCSLPNKSINI
ncbi:unnamed protein product [Phyllotreta striolata]|uniref:Adenosine kinase n=1 Tax=Phyllotreta striolata TaxID=444603 RepID=A0A9N9TTM1_PHYSR|nr:unnamed protein product [Phyllotreta striolata]